MDNYFSDLDSSLLSALYILGAAFLLSGLLNVVRRRNILRVAISGKNIWEFGAIIPKFVVLPIQHNFVGSMLLGLLFSIWSVRANIDFYLSHQAIQLFGIDHHATLLTVLAFIASATLAVSVNLFSSSLTNRQATYDRIRYEVKTIEDLSSSLCPKYFSVAALFEATSNLNNIKPSEIVNLPNSYEFLMSGLLELLDRIVSEEDSPFSDDYEVQIFANRCLSLEKIINESIMLFISGAVIVGIWAAMTVRLFSYVVVLVIIFVGMQIGQFQYSEMLADSTFIIMSTLIAAAIIDFTSSLKRELRELV